MAAMAARVFRWSLSAIWWSLLILYIIAPSRLTGVTPWLNFCFFKPGLLEVSVGLPAAVCLVLVPPSILTSSSRQANCGPHILGVVTLTACALKPFGGEAGWKAWIVYVGIVTGRAATAYLGILLLVISRSSILSDWHKLEYTSMLSLHRAAGWWVVAFSLLHSLAFVVYYLLRGGLQDLLISCIPVAVTCAEYVPCWNSLGLVNGFGVVATLVVVFLGFFSRMYMRRSFYNHFYFTHVPSSFVFMLFCGLHDFSMVLLMFPGLALYIKDRATARQSQLEVEVTPKLLCQEVSTVILLQWPCQASPLVPGSRWAYLSVPSISRNQWHPFSVIQHGGHAHVLLKNSGDWCEQLCNAVVSIGSACKIRVDGLYGLPLVAKELPCKQSLILVAGGVGISPFVDLLCGLHLFRSRWQCIKVIWAVRAHEYFGIAGAIDLQMLSQKAFVSVYITSQEASTYSPVGDSIGRSVADGELGTIDDCFRVVMVVLSFVLLAMGVAFSDLFHPLLTREDVRNITEYALMKRLLPLIVCLLIIMFISFGLWASKQTRMCSPFSRCHELQDRFVEDVNESNLQIFHAKPNLEEILQENVEGPAEVKACGPERMLASLSTITQRLKSRGVDVELDTFDSEL